MGILDESNDPDSFIYKEIANIKISNQKKFDEKQRWDDELNAEAFEAQVIKLCHLINQIRVFEKIREKTEIEIGDRRKEDASKQLQIIAQQHITKLQEQSRNLERMKDDEQLRKLEQSLKSTITAYEDKYNMLKASLGPIANDVITMSQAHQNAVAQKLQNLTAVTLVNANGNAVAVDSPTHNRFVNVIQSATSFPVFVQTLLRVNISLREQYDALDHTGQRRLLEDVCRRYNIVSQVKGAAVLAENPEHPGEEVAGGDIAKAAKGNHNNFAAVFGDGTAEITDARNDVLKAAQNLVAATVNNPEMSAKVEVFAVTDQLLSQARKMLKRVEHQIHEIPGLVGRVIPRRPGMGGSSTD